MDPRLDTFSLRFKMASQFINLTKSITNIIPFINRAEAPIVTIRHVKEYDIKKGGRNRRISIEVHTVSIPDSTDKTKIVEHIVPYLLIKKRPTLVDRINIASHKEKSPSKGHHDDDSSVDSSSLASVGESTFTSSPKREKVNSMPVVSESTPLISEDIGEISKNGDTWLISHKVRLKDMTITDVHNKRVTLELKYDQYASEGVERYFTFRTEEDALDFVQVCRHELDLNNEREETDLEKAVETIGIHDITKIKNEQLDLLVEICGAEDLQPGDLNSSDPYVVVKFGEKEVHRTKYIPKTLNPIWTLRQKAFFLFSIPAKDLFIENNGLDLLVYDFDFQGSHELLGAAKAPASYLYKAKEERLVLPLKPLTVAGRTTGFEKGRIAIRCRRASEKDKEFMQKFDEYCKQSQGLLKMPKRREAKVRGEVGSSALQSILERKVKVFLVDGTKVYKHKVVPRPDPENTTGTEWLSEADIERICKEPTRHYLHLGSGKTAKIYLEILGCDDLPNLETVSAFGNKTDSFVKIVHEDMVCQTDIIDDHSSPRWLPWTKRGFVFHTSYPSSVINLGVFDFDPGLPLLTSHDLVGRASVDLTNFRPGTEYELHYDLHNTSTAENRQKEGVIKIRLRIEIEDPRKYLLAGLAMPPTTHVNSKDRKDFACVNQCIHGGVDMKNFDLGTIVALLQEILNYQNSLYYIKDVVLDTLLWRFTSKCQFMGFNISYPLNSICAFYMATTLVENPRLLPSYSFFTIGLVLLNGLWWRMKHPDPWRRANTFQYYFKCLVLGKAMPLAPEKIDVNERSEEAKKFEESWAQVIAKAEAKAKRRADEVAAEQLEFQKELVEAGGTDTDISSSSGGPKINPVIRMAKPYLFPIQKQLLVACEVFRCARNILTWEESVLSFWLVLVTFVLGAVFAFFPWLFFVRWFARILAWGVFGPWMKLVDIIFFSTSSTDDDTLKEAEAEAADRAGRRKYMEKLLTEARIKNENSTKLRDMKQYFFGKYLTRVPIFKADRYVDRPLPSSSARKIEAKGDIATTAFEMVEQSEERITGQNLVGLMIPHVVSDDQLESNDLTQGKNEKSTHLAQIGGIIGVSAIATYYAGPYLMHLFH